MNSKRPVKSVGFPVFVIFSSLLLLFMLSTTTLLLPLRAVFADSYDDGYNEGCYDASRDLKGLNGHGYDESVHHGDTHFRTGYVNGYRTCYSNSGAGGEERGGGNYFQPRQPPPPPPLPPDDGDTDTGDGTDSSGSSNTDSEGSGSSSDSSGGSDSKGGDAAPE
jgi:uncharacterized membrane protein YgcG